MGELRADDLAIVIPTVGRPEILERTLAALASQGERGFETIVVYDGGEPEQLPGVRVLRQDHAGPGAARNRGVAATERSLVLFIGDDMVPRFDLVARHLDRHRREPAADVAVLGRIVWHPAVPDDRLHRWLDRSAALFDYRLLDEQGHEEAGWPRFYSSNVSLKRELFVAAGGFDPDFTFDYEDLDFGWRLGRAGMRLLYERDAVVEHLHAYDWPAVERRYESRAGAERLMMAKHGWFRPWFHDQLEAAMRERHASALWALAADRAPRRPAVLRRALELRADRHYRQRLAPRFMAAWERSAGGGERAPS